MTIEHTPDMESEKSPPLPSFKEYEPVFIQKEDFAQLVEVLFDMSPELMLGEEIANRMLEDKPIVRQKYSLPEQEILLVQPDEYYKKLEDLAKKVSVQIRGKEEFAQFFNEMQIAGAVHLSKHETIAMERMNDNDSASVVASKGSNLEHELIHAMQHKMYPRMSIARLEYEAYLANSNEDFLRKSPWLFLELISFSILPDQLADAFADYSASKSIEGSSF